MAMTVVKIRNIAVAVAAALLALEETQAEAQVVPLALDEATHLELALQLLMLLEV
jgi:hypothetical protein